MAEGSPSGCTSVTQEVSRSGEHDQPLFGGTEEEACRGGEGWVNGPGLEQVGTFFL